MQPFRSTYISTFVSVSFSGVHIAKKCEGMRKLILYFLFALHKDNYCLCEVLFTISLSPSSPSVCMSFSFFLALCLSNIYFLLSIYLRFNIRKLWISAITNPGPGICPCTARRDPVLRIRNDRHVRELGNAADRNVY